MNDFGEQDPARSGGAADEQLPASNMDVLKALADPVRMNLMYVLTRRVGAALPTMSVKELAAKLGEPQTKLYRHVRHLESAGLIRAVASRVVSGIIEQRYQAVQPEIVIGDRFTEQERVSPEAEAMTAAAFELYRRQFYAARRTAAAEPTEPSGPPPLLATSTGLLPAGRAAAIRDHLRQIFDEVAAACNASADADDEAGMVTVNVLIGFISQSQG